MTHEEFIKLAEKAGRNTQGLRPLARQVRALYDTIRTLQKDDNSFCYIAETIQKVRGDRTDAHEFMTRVKTYHHRDRKAAGDPLVDHAMQRRSPGVTTSTAVGVAVRPLAHAPDRSRIAPEAEMSPGRPDLSGEHLAAGQAGMGTHDKGPAPAAPKDGKSDGAHDLRALTASLHGRPGRRRVIPGG